MPTGTQIGKWKTHVRALDMRTVGLGGDSLIAYEKRRLRIGPLGLLDSYDGKPAVPVVVQDHPVVSDEIFEVFLRQFDYDSLDLNVLREAVFDSSDLWTLERVSIDAPYGDERITCKE